jgi:GAF domain-containing protein
VISVDDPVSGRRPDDEQLELLGVLAAHTATAIETARRLQALEGAVERHRAVLSSAPDCVIAMDATAACGSSTRPPSRRSATAPMTS